MLMSLRWGWGPCRVHDGREMKRVAGEKNEKEERIKQWWFFGGGQRITTGERSGILMRHRCHNEHGGLFQSFKFNPRMSNQHFQYASISVSRWPKIVDLFDLFTLNFYGNVTGGALPGGSLEWKFIDLRVSIGAFLSIWNLNCCSDPTKIYPSKQICFSFSFSISIDVTAVGRKTLDHAKICIKNKN